MRAKPVSESLIHNVEVVLPNDTNSLGILLGGRLLNWMDLAAAITAQTHANGPCVTAGIDKVSFREPVHTGEFVHVQAQVTRAFRSSMEIFVRVWKQNPADGIRIPTNEARFSFVALDGNGRPRPVPELLPETEEEKQLWEEAGRRKAKPF